ncbi:hypothetical protein, partial [Massilia glaciei]|uniref:hypothetical protein n=1 Tax=Massilia glaciei TaxID=1524097 RepID=UPI001E6251BE
MPRPSSSSPTIWQCVRLSSSTSTRAASNKAAGGRCGAVCAGTPKRAVKWQTVLSPSALSTQLRPPISATSCATMVRPSPVPPN